MFQVVAKSNYTDPIMSSSLQNIPNGISIYNSTPPGGSSANQQLNAQKYGRHYQQQQQVTTQNPHALYETKSTTNISQSLSPILRDTSLSSRELNSITSSNSYLKSINHNTSSSTSSSASPPTTINNNGYNQAMYQQKQQLYQAINKYSRENTPTSGGGGGGGTTNLMRTTGGGGSGQLMTDSSNIYGAITTPLHNPPSQGHHKQLHHNILTSSDTNLSKLSLFDRIHSTSSSNESVCSSSSRDLNLSSHQPYHQQPPKTQQLYGTVSGGRELNKANSGSTKQLNIWNDYQQSMGIKPQPIYNDVISSHNNNNNNNGVVVGGVGFIPKKQQRGHKDVIEIVKAKPYNHQQRPDNW